MPLLDKSAFTDPTLPIPSWGNIKGAVRGLMGMVTPPDPYEEAGRMVQQARGGDYLGALETGFGAMPTQGIFAGPMAKTANKEALALAEKMAGEGADRKAIWDKTGWFQGADNKWKFEIPDTEASFDFSKMPSTPGRFDLAKQYFEQHGVPAVKLATGQYPNLDKEAFSWAQLQIDKAMNAGVPLSKVMSHDDLYMAYPELADIRTRPEQSMNFGGTFNPATREMTINNQKTLLGDVARGPLSTALHETQHAIQQIEGWPGGGSPNDFMYQNSPLFNARKSYETAEEAYKRLAGEVEARSVQDRYHLSPEELRSMAPWITQDTPFERQIINYRADKQRQK